jgi:hypothetical protein
LLVLNASVGIVISHEIKSSIKEVVSFYKSGMLYYGWSLDNGRLIKVGGIDCPGCRKVTQ